MGTAKELERSTTQTQESRDFKRERTRDGRRIPRRWRFSTNPLICPLELAIDAEPSRHFGVTYRMTFRGFQKAFPEGEVFLNKPSPNPLLRLLDMMTEITFGWGIGRQHQEEAPVMDNMDRSDNRLPNKTYVWGITIGQDATCWTDDFVVDNDWIVNARVGGRDIVVSL